MSLLPPPVDKIIAAGTEDHVVTPGSPRYSLFLQDEPFVTSFRDIVVVRHDTMRLT